MLRENRVHEGDCLDLLPKVQDESVDLVFADYPFDCQDGRRDYLGFVRKTADEFMRVLVKGGNLVVVNNPHNMARTAHLFGRFTVRNGLALVRERSFRPPLQLAFRHNYALLLVKGSKRLIWNGPRKHADPEAPDDVMEYRNGYRHGKTMHPQAMPLDLVKRLVLLLSREGGLVLDPFAGSGTTLVAAAQAKRRWIGMEFAPEYAGMAAERVEREG